MSITPDELALQAIASGSIKVNVETGEIFNRQGARAEKLDKRLAYGRVVVRRRPLSLAMAHRVVWLAAHGFIPSGLFINHINRVRWDNRLANLELVTPGGNSRHARGIPYACISAGYDPDEIATRVQLSTNTDAPGPYAGEFPWRVGKRQHFISGK